jgi:hypothetical protein
MPEIRGGTSREEAYATSFEMIWTYPTETPRDIGAISWIGNVKRGRERPNLTCESL